jgi:hypothetical protein
MSFLVVFYMPLAWAYPFDAYEETGIRRLEQVRLTQLGEIPGTKQPSGATLPLAEVDIRFEGQSFELPAADETLTKEVVALLGEQAPRYSIAVLDMSNPEQLAYAEYRGDHRQNVGSVGKILGALGFFQALADAHPDVEKRVSLLRNTTVTADEFTQWDHHDIRLFDVEKRELTRRPMKAGDQGNLYEYLDWTLSVSSNAAAAMMMRDAMLLRQFGKDYPIADDKIMPFIKDSGRESMTKLFQRTFWDPITANGLSVDQIRQGSFFTRKGKHLVAGGGQSYASARSLMQLLLRMEQGQLVDAWSSRELKRLLYVTERRIRYASAPRLKPAAVYFKSGSLYSCMEEEGFTCGKYQGNKRNYMNSVAIVEQQVGDVKLHYAVALISNVLRENSAVAHQTLGTYIHKLIKSRNGVE